MATTEASATASAELTTAFLSRLVGGNSEAEAELAPIIFRKLQRVALGHLRRERPNHTLQATAPVNEVSSRLRDHLAAQPDRALERLKQFDPRASQIVEMHFFGGLSFEEMGLVPGVSARTAKRDWRMARAWLRGELLAGA